MTYDVQAVIDQERIDEIMAETAEKIAEVTGRLEQMAYEEIRKTCVTVVFTKIGE